MRTTDPHNVRHFSEVDWNELSVREVEEKGRDAANSDKYHASKTLAERAAWDFLEENKGKVSFDLVTINPPFVYGPFLHEVKRLEDLNASAFVFYLSIVKTNKTKEELTTIT